MLNELAQSWLTLQCQMIPGVRRAILMLNSLHGGTIAPAASWPSGATDTNKLVSSATLALQRRAPVVQPIGSQHVGNQEGPVVVACPLLQEDELFGVVTLEVETLEKQQQQTLLQLLRWGSAWLQLLPKDDGVSAMAAQLTTVIEVVARGLDSSSMDAAATGVITQLAQAFSCDRVSFGLLEGRHMRVHALSHSAQIDRRSELVRSIEAAMEEALDELAPLVHPPLQPKDAHAQPTHELLCAGHEGAAACTFLLSNAGKPIGAFTFERRHGPAFDAATMDVLDAIVALVGPVLELKRLHDQPLLAKARDAFFELLGGLFGRGHLKGKLVAAGLVGLGIWLSMATGTYRISATATLEGTEQRALVAPMEGYIEQAHARAGELVKKGDLIATLDDRDLELEHRRWASERDDLHKRHGRAIGSLDRAEAAIMQAQLGKANAQLALIEEQLARTRIIAPIDGVIVSGDLSRSLGAPVERGQVLFELAPLNTYRMALQVHESDIGHVKRGQSGHLALSAVPGERLPFVVEDIIGIAETDEGKNGFRVEARLEGTNNHLRPGMRGVGKIEVDERSLLWVWGHALFERISLWLWSRLP